jgi:hypothetical protein
MDLSLKETKENSQKEGKRKLQGILSEASLLQSNRAKTLG